MPTHVNQAAGRSETPALSPCANLLIDQPGRQECGKRSHEGHYLSWIPGAPGRVPMCSEARHLSRTLCRSPARAARITSGVNEHEEHTNMKPKNTICLWFDKDAHEAARFYAATFPDSE